MRIVTVPYDHPDAQKLDAQVQQEYRERYHSEGDVTPLTPSMFAPPHGRFLLAYDPDGAPVGCGGWRSRDRDEEGYQDGDAEIKRLYVVPEMRNRGLARRILALLEEDARAAGRRQMVLETGTAQPEAINLYRSSGYVPAKAKFGVYRHSANSRCFTKPLR